MYSVENVVFTVIRPELINSYKSIGRSKTYRENGCSLLVNAKGSRLKLPKQQPNGLKAPENSFVVENESDLFTALKIGMALKKGDIKYLITHFNQLSAVLLQQIQVDLVKELNGFNWKVGKNSYPYFEYPTIDELTTAIFGSGPSRSSNQSFARISQSALDKLCSHEYANPVTESIGAGFRQLKLTFVPKEKILKLSSSLDVGEVEFKNVDAAKAIEIKNALLDDDFDAIFKSQIDFEESWCTYIPLQIRVHDHFILCARFASSAKDIGYWLVPRRKYGNAHQMLKLNRSPVKIGEMERAKAITLIKSDKFIPDDLINFHFINWYSIEPAVLDNSSFEISEGIATISCIAGKSLLLKFDGLIHSGEAWQMPVDESFDAKLIEQFDNVKQSYLNVGHEDYEEDYPNLF